jgi:hypothetical protein
MALVLHACAGRNFTFIQERRLLRMLHFRPQLHWSIFAPQFSRLIQSFARQESFFTQAGAVLEKRAPSETVLLEKTAVAIFTERTHALMRVISNTRRESAALLERHFLERRESQFSQVTRELAGRAQRIERMQAPPVGMHLRREQPAVHSETGGRLAAREKFPETARSSVLQPPGPQFAVPAINVDQLTEHVIRQLDRQIVARRERMGRF